MGCCESKERKDPNDEETQEVSQQKNSKSKKHKQKHINFKKRYQDDNQTDQSSKTSFYTPPPSPNDILYQEDSSLILGSYSHSIFPAQKKVIEYDTQNRKTQIKQNYEEITDQLIRGGSVPIYLKRSQAIIIPNNQQGIDIKTLLEDTKFALEAFQKSKQQSDAQIFTKDFENQVESQVDVFKFNYSNVNDNINSKGVFRWDNIDIGKELNLQQQKAFQQFKQQFQQEINQNSQTFNDFYIVRFLKAKQFNIQEASLLFKNHLQWRNQNNMENIFSFEFNELEKVKEIYPHGYHFSDIEGRPIYVERLGQLKYEELFKRTNQERLMKYYAQHYEKMIKYIFQLCSAQKGKRVDKITIILDLKNSSFKTEQLINFLKLTTNLTKENYPEILHRMYIINNGFMFNLVWGVVKNFLSSSTQQKIQILGSKYMDSLIKEIPIENLPKFIGGKCNCKEENCINYNYGPQQI